jgi:WD40 repeat protein
LKGIPSTHSHRLCNYRVVVIRRDREKRCLTDELVKFNLGEQTSDVPYRMKVHPSGKALVITNALGGIKVVRIDRREGEALPTLSAPPSAVAKAAEKCSFMGTIKSLSFSSDGTRLALGADDGKLHILSWPALEKKGAIDVTKTTTKGVRNVDFSAAHDDRLLLAVDEWGSCFLYDTEKLKVVGELEKPADMPRLTLFRVLSRAESDGNVLYGVANCNKLGYVLRWKQETENSEQKDHGDGQTPLRFKLQKVSRAVVPSPVCGCALSHDGSTLAVVTPDAEQVIVSTDTLKRIKLVKGAHMAFATAVGFTEDDDAIVSVSADGSAVLTPLVVDGNLVLKMLILTFLMALLAMMVHVLGRESVKAQPVKTLDVESMLAALERFLRGHGIM